MPPLCSKWGLPWRTTFPFRQHNHWCCQKVWFLLTSPCSCIHHQKRVANQVHWFPGSSLVSSWVLKFAHHPGAPSTFTPCPCLEALVLPTLAPSGLPACAKPLHLPQTCSGTRTIPPAWLAVVEAILLPTHKWFQPLWAVQWCTWEGTAHSATVL